MHWSDMVVQSIRHGDEQGKTILQIYVVEHMLNTVQGNWTSQCSEWPTHSPGEIRYLSVVNSVLTAQGKLDISVYRARQINASQEMKRNWSAAQMLAATVSAWLVFIIPLFPGGGGHLSDEPGTVLSKKVWVFCSETIRKFTEPWKHLLAHSQTALGISLEKLLPS